MNAPSSIPDLELGGTKELQGGVQLNLKRVLDRIIRMWYVLVISLTVAMVIAFLINRYSTRIFPVKASIIIKENEENAGAKFLYNNALINPYRNFLNEIYIMKSYPLLQEVIEDLGFEVSYFREGDIMTTEYYVKDFPVKFRVLPGDKMPYGKNMYFEVKDEYSFSLQYVPENE
ncbi:MAG: capsular biosynthesis protein, partial [Marivirga sp.]|nr:capsular biosynthesis protein [Marivirga sp.]